VATAKIRTSDVVTRRARACRDDDCRGNDQEPRLLFANLLIVEQIVTRPGLGQHRPALGRSDLPAVLGVALSFGAAQGSAKVLLPHR